MAIDFRAVNASPSFSINSIGPTIPAAQVTGDMMLLVAAGKPFDLGWSVSTSGWASLGSGASGSTAAGVDTGSMKAEVWWKEALIDTEATPTVTEGTPVFNIVGGVIIVFSKDVSETWETPVVVYGGDESSGTDISATMASNPGVTAGDYIVSYCGINTDAMGPLTGILTPTQTGVTFGTVTGRIQAETTSGGDMALDGTSCPVDSGTGSAAPVLTGTGTASGGADRLEAAFIRLRVSAGAAANYPMFTVPDASIYPGPSTP
jgi:hypothetical protein